MSFHCKFCPNIISQEEDTSKLLRCIPCNTRYSYCNDKELYGYAIDLKVGNLSYSAVFLCRSGTFELNFCNANDLQFEDSIVKLNYHPNITPTNFPTKLKTYITFS